MEGRMPENGAAMWEVALLPLLMWGGGRGYL